MRIIDVNMYIGGRDSYGKFVTAEDILAQMELYHIDHVVCCNEYALLDPQAGNAEMKKIAERSAGKIGVSAVLDPILGANNIPGEGTLVERLKTFKPESLHVFPGNARTVFSAFYWDEIFEAANELHLPIIVDDKYPQEFFVHLPEVAAQYPDAKFVLVRYGFCRERHVLPLLKKCKNVYLTMEILLDNNQIEEILELAGVEKLLFGSSWPIMSPSGALGLALLANIPDVEREKILYRNWEAMTA